MSSRQEDSLENNLATTAVKEVVTTVVSPSVPLTSDLPSAPAETNPAYAAAIDKVLAAFADFSRSTWGLAFALADFRDLHEKLFPDRRLTDKQLVVQLGLKLSHARVGQLVNTVRAFPRNQVDQSIDFRVYEQARLLKPHITPERRLKLVKAHPSTAAMAKIKPAATGRKQTAGREPLELEPELVLRIKSAVGGGDTLRLVAEFCGEAIELPDELEATLRTYATPLFAKVTAADE